MKFNNVNCNGENVVVINLKLSIFSFLKIVEIEFKLKFQSFFLGVLPIAHKRQLNISFTSLVKME